MNKLKVKVLDLMSKETVTLKRNDRLTLADQAMKARAIRHMPVLDDNGQVRGILSQRDLIRGALLKNLGYGDFLEDNDDGQLGR